MPTNDADATRRGDAADVEFGFGNETTAPGDARRALAPIVGEGDFAAGVTLAASELVSNVVLHTDDGGVLRAWDADPLRVEVHDSSGVLPAPRPEQEVGGRGLGIIDHVSSNWGAEPTDDGKVVWAEFERPEQQPPADPDTV